jgi:UDP-2,3-diacylglucosamine pyrophosphatase LpxH
MKPRLFVLPLVAAPWLYAASDRTTAFISDTHFGVGRGEDGQWHNFEDARWAGEFTAFLAGLDRRGDGKTDLVINGDMFELWQSLEYGDCTVEENRDLGCTEARAIQRLERALAGHTPEMAALGKFASAGDNRVVIVPGNHDAALLFDSLAARVIKAIAAPVGRVAVDKRGYWISTDGRIIAEHGQQIGREPNRFNNWPKPFLRWRSDLYLERPWGEQFVQMFYNSLEIKYPILDNFRGDTDGVRYVLALEGPSALGNISNFLRFAVLDVSMRQFAADLGGEGKAPQYDIAAIRMQGSRFLLESLEADDPVRKAAQSQIEKGEVVEGIEGMSDDEIAGICIARERRQASPCPKASLGARAQALYTTRDQIFVKHADEARERTGRDFDLLVYSHTHAALPAFRPSAKLRRRWTPLFINSGAWQRVVTPLQMRAMQKARGLGDMDVLELKPEDLPACYSVVIVPPYEESPRPLLRYWTGKERAERLEDECE